jgi:ubiquitin-protein ligase E3 C
MSCRAMSCRVVCIGGELRPLDLADLQANVNYSGGYHPSQPYIQMFWSVVAEFSPQEQGDFLKFITSCSRQPLLGFDKLNPRIGIQEVPAVYAEDGPGAAPRLPSAGTCFNLLKLPRYQSKDVLREKLKYAIKCNTGFELS